MNLNVGSGSSKIPDYLTIDLRKEYHPDFCEDIRTIEFEPGSVDNIYCSHILEHFTLREAIDLVNKFHTWQKVGSKLYVAVPDMDAISKLIITGHRDFCLLGFLFGIPVEGNLYFHKWGYTRDTLVRLVTKPGYVLIKEFEPLAESHEPKLKDLCVGDHDAAAASFHGMSISLNLLFERS